MMQWFFLNEFEENGFEESIEQATQLCEELDIATDFTSFRRTRRNVIDESISPREFFLKKNFFEYMIDVTTNSISERFTALKSLDNIFSFLFDLSKFEKTGGNELLRASSQRLQQALTVDAKRDIDADDLYNELKTLINVTKNEKFNNALEILNFMSKTK